MKVTVQLEKCILSLQKLFEIDDALAKAQEGSFTLDALLMDRETAISAESRDRLFYKRHQLVVDVDD